MSRLTAVLGLAAMVWACAAVNAQEGEGVARDALVIVAQLNPSDVVGDGCSSASVFALPEGRAIQRAPREYPFAAVGGLASTTDLRQIIAPGNAWSWSDDYVHHLLRLQAVTDGYDTWSRQVIVGANFAPGRGIVILPDDETLLVETVGEPRPSRGQVATQPFAIRKYRLSEVGPDGRIGPEHGAFDIPAVTTQLLATLDGRVVHIVSGGRHVVYSMDVATMSEIAEVVVLPPDNDSSPEFEIHAALSPDERYLVTRRHRGNPRDALNVVDLSARRAWTVDLPEGSCEGDPGCGDVAFNHGPVNDGLLAVREQGALGIYAFDPERVTRLGGVPLPRHINFAYGPIAWSGDGGSVIADAWDETGSGAFRVIQVRDDGRTLAAQGWLDGCMEATNDFPYALLTSNRKLARVPTLTPSPTPTRTPTFDLSETLTPVPMATGTGTATARATGTPSATGSATGVGAVARVWLPVAWGGGGGVDG